MCRFIWVIKIYVQTSKAHSLLLLVHIFKVLLLSQLLFSPSSLFSQTKTWKESKQHLPEMFALPKSNSNVSKILQLLIVQFLFPSYLKSGPRSWAQDGDSHGSILLRKEKVRRAGLRKESRARARSQQESSLSLKPWGALEHGFHHGVASFPFWGKGSFCAPESVYHWPHPGAEELLKFPGNSRLSNSHLAKGSSPERKRKLKAINSQCS